MMVEKNFQKKIISYLDGSLSKDDAAEFEAYVATHPSFKKQIQEKQEEIETLKSRIPAAQLSQESSESLNREMKASVYNLLKEEPKSFFDSLRMKWEEWANR